MSSSELLRVDHLGAAWDGAAVLHDVSFTIGDNERVALVGPNGSGKTTLLRCLAGLELTTAGIIAFAGAALTGRAPHRRGLGLLRQEPALFPRRNVAENIAYGLEVTGKPVAEQEARVAELAALLHLEPLLDRDPRTLSGGERQRVALARTLAPRPRLVLLDEPFAAIDPELRAELMVEFVQALRSTGTAALHVTHDRDEALFLGERVLVLLGGRLEQVGPPAAVFAAPANARVARFLGYNLLPMSDGELAVHPRETRLVPGAAGPGPAATVTAIGQGDPGPIVYLRTDDGRRIESRAEPPQGVRIGDRLRLVWSTARSVPP